MNLHYDSLHDNEQNKRLKRLHERGLKLPWERNVEDTSDTNSRGSVKHGSGKSVRETEDSASELEQSE